MGLDGNPFGFNREVSCGAKLFRINVLCRRPPLAAKLQSCRVDAANYMILMHLAPQVGFEPTTLRLTAESRPFYLNLPGFAYIC